MLKLSYERKSNEFITVTLLGSARGIRDLYWQLTHNYKAQDETEITNIKVSNLDGEKVYTGDLMIEPWEYSTELSTPEDRDLYWQLTHNYQPQRIKIC